MYALHGFANHLSRSSGRSFSVISDFRVSACVFGMSFRGFVESTSRRALGNFQVRAFHPQVSRGNHLRAFSGWRVGAHFAFAMFDVCPSPGTENLSLHRSRFGERRIATATDIFKDRALDQCARWSIFTNNKSKDDRGFDGEKSQSSIYIKGGTTWYDLHRSRSERRSTSSATI